MNLTEKIIKEFEERFIKSDKRWELVLNTPRKIMMSDIEAMRMFIEIQSFLLSSLNQIATEAIEAVRLEERGNDTYKSFHEVGYNSAIEDMKQKAKKFLDENFSEKKD